MLPNRPLLQVQETISTQVSRSLYRSVLHTSECKVLSPPWGETDKHPRWIDNIYRSSVIDKLCYVLTVDFSKVAHRNAQGPASQSSGEGTDNRQCHKKHLCQGIPLQHVERHGWKQLFIKAGLLKLVGYWCFTPLQTSTGISRSWPAEDSHTLTRCNWPGRRTAK